MKQLKRFFILILTLLFLFSCSITAFASGDGNIDGGGGGMESGTQTDVWCKIAKKIKRHSMNELSFS